MSFASPSTVEPTEPSSAETIAIDVSNVTVSYGPVPALLDVSFRIPEGMLVGVIGPNGSGKSTLIKTVLGFEEPDVGEIRLFGESISKSRGRIAYVPQHGAVDWEFPITVREVALMGRYGKIPWWRDPSAKDRQIADNALGMVRMDDFANRQIGQLSGGQRQRVFMARAIAQGADILLLDEPFSGVDSATEHAILDVLQRMKQAGRTVMVVHHDLATAAEYFDRLILVKQRLFAFGPPRQVLNPNLLGAVYEGRLKVFGELVASADAEVRPAGEIRESRDREVQGNHADSTRDQDKP